MAVPAVNLDPGIKKSRLPVGETERRPASNPSNDGPDPVPINLSQTGSYGKGNGKILSASAEIALKHRRREADPYSSFRALLREHELTLDQLAGIWNCCRNTAGARVRDPGSITLWQLRQLSKHGYISREEILTRAWK